MFKLIQTLVVLSLLTLTACVPDANIERSTFIEHYNAVKEYCDAEPLHTVDFVVRSMPQLREHWCPAGTTCNASTFSNDLFARTTVFLPAPQGEWVDEPDLWWSEGRTEDGVAVASIVIHELFHAVCGMSHDHEGEARTYWLAEEAAFVDYLKTIGLTLDEHGMYSFKVTEEMAVRFYTHQGGDL